MNVGVIDLSSDVWTGGSTYSDVTIRSAKAAARRAADLPRVSYITSNRDSLPESQVRREPVPPLPLETKLLRTLARPERTRRFKGETRVRRMLKVPDAANPIWLADHFGLNVVFPVMAPNIIVPRSRVRTLAWIPDFQHLVHPEFFSKADIAERNRDHAGLVEKASALVLSSMSAREDCLRAFPESRAKIVVLRFPSRFAFSPPEKNPDEVRETYHLPEKYLLCANQYWAHKNHVMLVEAIALLKRQGLVVSAVLTGLPLDTRSSSNDPTSELMQGIARHGLGGHVLPLGLVPRSDLEGLLRGCTFVVQPSFHEGWNTTVQDAKALGKPLLCADTPVLREQAPESDFFEFNVESLALRLRGLWERSSPGWDRQAESAGISAEIEMAREHGEMFLETCRDVSVRK